MITKAIEGVRYAAYVLAGSERDRENLPQVDANIARALRLARRARNLDDHDTYNASRAVIAELNETRRLIRAGKFKRARMAFRAAAVVCAGLASGAAQASPFVNIHDAPTPWLAYVGLFGLGSIFLGMGLGIVLKTIRENTTRRADGKPED